MARTLNRVQLIGYLGGDPEARTTSNGNGFTTFSLATNRQWTTPDGTLNTETDWHRVVAWGVLGETCAAHLRKGRLVYIEGRLAYRQWEVDGQKRERSEIVASDMLMLDARPTEETSAQAQPSTSRTAGGAQRRSRVQEVEPDMDLAELPF